MTHICTGQFARSILHFLLLCATVTSVLAASTTTPQLLLQGRFGNVKGLQTAKSLPVLFSWPSSSVILTFQSSSINITLTALQSTVQYSSYNRFTFWLDSKQVAIQTSDPNNTSINWSATGLSSATHNLTITKLNEATYGEATLDSIVLGTNGKFLSPTMPGEMTTGRRIQFIGDSFLTGYANTGGTDNCNYDSCTAYGCLPSLESCDATLAWGPLTASNLQADYQVLAWSGSGVVTYDVPIANAEATAAAAAEASPEAATEEPLAEWEMEAQYPLDSDLFDRQVAGDNSTIITNFTQWVPQVVVMAGGANDFALDATDLETWQTPYLEFIDQVNKVYSSPQIVILTYPLESGPTGSYNQTSYYLQYMTSLYVSARLQGLSNVQIVQLNGINFPTDGWCDGHPSVAAHANIANQLTAYLQAILPRWANSTYPLIATS